MTSSRATWDVGLSIAPYPGLRPFRREEADIFFGRDEQVDHLLAKLEQNHFLGVVGPSGAGKSSLVRAGLLSALEGGFLARAGVSWHVVEMRPGSHPLRMLAENLLESGVLGEHWDDHPQGVPFLTALLQRGPLSLINLLRERQLPPSANVLLLVDQFEEIFRFHDYGDPNEAIAFVSLLLATATQVGTPVFVVLTMRSDYLGECAVFQGLPEALNDSQFLTPRLTREQCEAAIQGPAAVFDAQVEPGLVNRILNDMGTDPDQLPLMQHALMRVWTLATKSREQARTSSTLVGGTVPSENSPNRRDLQLTLTHYEAVGGLAQGLSRHADEVFDALIPEDRHVAEVLFRGLSERSQGQRDTRRPVVLKAIANVAGVSCEQVARIVEAFRHPDCSFLTPHAGIPLTDDSLLDVSHESLIRQWERMATWVEKEHQSATMYRRLDQTARLWWQRQAGLWGDPDLGHALEWQTREKPNAEWANRYGGDFGQAMEFLRLSQEEHQRRQEEMLENERLRRRVHKLKLGLGVGGIVLLIISMLMFWTNYQRKEAEQARDDARSAEARAAVEADNARDQQKAAERQQRIATAQRLAVEANVARDRQPQLSLLLAVAGLRATRPDGQHELSAEQALRDALAVDPGYRLRGHQGPIESLTMSFDGRWLVSTSLDGTARLWSLSARDPSRDSWLLQPPMSNFLTDATTDEVEQLSFARQTSLMAAWPLVHANARWDECFVHRPRTSQATPADDNDRDPFSVALLQAAPASKGAVAERGPITIAISPDSHWLVTADIDQENWLWDLHAAEPTRSPLRLPGLEPLPFERLEPDGKSGFPKQIAPFSRTRPMSPFSQISPHPRQLVFSRDSRWILTTYTQGGGRVWDLAADEPAETGIDLRNDGKVIEMATFSSDGRWLVTARGDASIQIWDLTSAPLQLSPQSLPDSWDITGLALSRDGRWLAATSGNANIQLWDLRTDEPWKEVRELSSSVLRTDMIAISPDSRWLVAAMIQPTRHLRPTTVALWDLHAEPFVVKGTDLTGHATLINALAFSPPGTPPEDPADEVESATSQETTSQETRWLITAGVDGTAGRWDLLEIARHQRARVELADPGQVASIDGPEDPLGFRLLVGHEDSIRAVTTVPSGKWAITGSGDTTVRLWDLTGDSSGAPIVLRGHDGPVNTLAVSADEKWLASGSVDRTIRLWDLSSPALLTSSLMLRGHPSEVSRVIFGREEHQLLTASWDGVIRCWDESSGSERYRIEAHAGAVNSLAMSANGNWMISGGADGKVKVWSVADGAEVRSIASCSARMVCGSSREARMAWSGFGIFGPDNCRANHCHMTVARSAPWP